MVRSQRNFYDHAIRAAGATIVEVGLPDRFAGADVRRPNAVSPLRVVHKNLCNDYGASDIRDDLALPAIPTMVVGCLTGKLPAQRRRANSLSSAALFPGAALTPSTVGGNVRFRAPAKRTSTAEMRRRAAVHVAPSASRLRVTICPKALAVGADI